MLKMLCFLVWLAGPVAAAGWREDFRNLDRWEPLLFPKIPAHSVYQSVSLPGGTALRCESRDSASGLMLTQLYDIQAAPVLRFEWKVESMDIRGDPRKKSGDDYPLRLYVSFLLDEKSAGWLDRLARGLYGQLPPHSSLNYVWSASDLPSDEPYPSPYTRRLRMVPLQRGPGRMGVWVAQQVDVVADYRRAFGQDPPPGPSQLAVMNDSDNTHGAAVSWLRHLEALPR